MSPDLHHLSGAYAVDALDDAERASFEQHLAGCADCRAEVAELSATAGSLASLTETTPPAVAARLGAVRHRAGAPAPAAPPRIPVRPARLAGPTRHGSGTATAGCRWHRRADPSPPAAPPGSPLPRPPR